MSIHTVYANPAGRCPYQIFAIEVPTNTTWDETVRDAIAKSRFSQPGSYIIICDPPADRPNPRGVYTFELEKVIPDPEPILRLKGD